MLIKCTYFKMTGKYYSEGAIYLPLDRKDPKSLQEAWDWVKKAHVSNRLPGLAPGIGPSEFIVLISVPEHPQDHPKLIIPEGGT